MNRTLRRMMSALLSASMLLSYCPSMAEEQKDTGGSALFGVAVVDKKDAEPVLTEQTIEVSLFTDRNMTQLVSGPEIQTGVQKRSKKLMAAPKAGQNTSDGETTISISGELPEGTVAAGWPASPDMGKDMELIKAYELVLIDTEGQQKPLQDVDVQLNIAADPDAEVYSVSDQGARKLSAAIDSSVRFRADGSPVYAVVRTILEKTLVASDNNTYKITVEYDSDSGLPSEEEGARLDVSELTGSTLELYKDKTAKAMGVAELSFARAFDISIEDTAGTKYQPTKDVSVSIQLMNKQSLTDAQIVHFGKTTDVITPAAEASADGVVLNFKTDGFSIYVIGEEDTDPRVHYRFWWSKADVTNNSATPYREIALKNGETLLVPADPADESRGEFKGWKTMISGSETDFTFSNTPVTGAANQNVDIYATFGGEQYATFQSLYIDMKRTVFHVEPLTKSGDTYTLNLANVPSYGAPVGYKFLGWSLTQPTDTLGYGENIPKSGEGRYYKPNETITDLTGSVTLYPVCKKMYTVSLDGNGGTINNLPVYKIQATNDDTWGEVLGVLVIARGGYSRNNGWFDGADASANSVTLSGSIVLSEDKTYYLHWDATTTTVTVKYWKEPVDNSANSKTPYELIDSEVIEVLTGTKLSLSVTSMTIPAVGGDINFAVNTVRNNIATGGSKINGGTFVADNDLKYFRDIQAGTAANSTGATGAISAYDADGNYHTTAKGDTSVWPVADNGSTIIDVWYNRKTYQINYTFKLRSLGTNAYVDSSGISRVNTKLPANGYYTIRLGESLSNKWPNVDNYEFSPIGSLGFSVVSLGLRQSGNNYPDAVSALFDTPLSFVNSQLLDCADNSGKIELWGRYNNNNFKGGLETATLNEYYQESNGNYTTETKTYKYGIGQSQNDAEPYTTQVYNGYVLNVQKTLDENPNAYDVRQNPNGTISIEYKRNGPYVANVYYDLAPYSVALHHGATALSTETASICYKHNIDSKMKTSELAGIYNDPYTSNMIPAYLEWDGHWYTDEDCNSDYVIESATVMPASNIILYPKLTPRIVTVHVDNGIEIGDQTITDPQLNLSGSEMGKSIRYLDYQHEYGTTDTPYVAHEHTIAEFLPTYWVNPVWENHVFTGWTYCEGVKENNEIVWGNPKPLVDINTPVDKHVKLEGHWQEMTRHSVHYIENGKEVYLDPEAYVEGKTVVVKGTDTEIYHKATEIEEAYTEVFQYWYMGEEDNDPEKRYHAGDTIIMGTSDITLRAKFAPGGITTGSEKATYTFKVKNASDEWETYYEEIVYRGERLSPPPETPAGNNSSDVFEGWYLDEQLTQRFNGFGDVLSSPVNTTLYASFNRPWRVTYRGYDADGAGELITVQTYLHDGSENLNTMGVGAEYTYKSGSKTYALIGWDTTKRSPGTIPSSYWSGYTDKKVTSDMTLYPVLEDGFWLTFHQDENMVTIPNKYYARSQNLNFTWPDPDEVTRKNYIFTGKWYTDSARTQEFNWNQTLTEDTTIYAGWEPDETVTNKYTVVWWVEKADSNGTLSDTSNYVYSNSVTVDDIKLGTEILNTQSVTTSHGTAAANTVTHADLVYENGTNNSGFFQVNNSLSDSSTTVVDDGSAKLNIYVQRKRYMLRFNVRVGNQNRGRIRFGNNDYDTNWSETVWYQMTLAGKWPVDTGDGNTEPKLTMLGNFKYNGWDYTNDGDANTVSKQSTVPDTVEKDWLTYIGNNNTTITFNLLGDGVNTQTRILYHFLNDTTKDNTVASNYESRTYDNRSFDQTMQSNGNYGAKDILGYDKYNSDGVLTTNPVAASGSTPRTFNFYYIRQSYKLHLHDANGAEVSGSPITLLVGESLAGKIDDPSTYGISTPDGKEFAGWSRSADALVDVYASDTTATMPLYDIHYYLHWKDTQVIVTLIKSELDESGNVVEMDEAVTGNTVPYGPLVYGSKLSEFGLVNQELENYKFMGWLNADTNKPIALTTEIKDNIRVKGDYRDLRSKALYYDLNGGTLQGGQSDPIDGTTLVSTGKYKDNDQYMVGASVPVKNVAATKLIFPDGKVDFAYWNTQANGSGDSYYPNDAIAIPSGVDVTLYAIYTPKMETTLVYDLNFDSQPTPKVSVKFWDYRDQTKPQGFLKVNDPYTVGMMYQGTTSVTLEDLKYNGKSVEYMHPGYTFLGWDENKDLNYETETPAYQNGDTIRVTPYNKDNLTYTETHTLYAIWKPIELPVTVYEVTKGDYAHAVEKPIVTGQNDYIVRPDGTTGFAATADSAVATSYNAYTRNAVPTTDTYGKAVLDGSNTTVIKWIRFNDTTNIWQYATTGETAPTADSAWTSFSTDTSNPGKLRLYYYPQEINSSDVFWVTRDEDGNLTQIVEENFTGWSTTETKTTWVTITYNTAWNSADTTAGVKGAVEQITKTEDNTKWDLKGFAIGSNTLATNDTGLIPTPITSPLYLKNTVDGTQNANAEADLATSAPYVGNFAIYVIYEKSPSIRLTVTKTWAEATGTTNNTPEIELTIKNASGTALTTNDFAGITQEDTTNVEITSNGMVKLKKPDTSWGTTATWTVILPATAASAAETVVPGYIATYATTGGAFTDVTDGKAFGVTNTRAICKIVTDDGFFKAYPSLEAAIADVNDNTSDNPLNSKDGIQIQMLVSTTELSSGVTLNENKTVTITTANPNAGDGYPYNNGTAGTATIKRGTGATGDLITNNGTMTLTNVTLDGNNAEAAGALVNSSGTLNISEGTTLTNAVSSSGPAAVNVSGGTMNMTAGSITGNKSDGGAVSAASGAAINFSGTLSVTGNTGKTDNTKQRNVYVDRNDAINVSGPITGGTIGVYGEDDFKDIGEQFATFDTTAVTGDAIGTSLERFVNDRETIPGTTTYLTGAYGGPGVAVWGLIPITVEKTWVENPTTAIKESGSIVLTVLKSDGTTGAALIQASQTDSNVTVDSTDTSKVTLSKPTGATTNTWTWTLMVPADAANVTETCEGYIQNIKPNFSSAAVTIDETSVPAHTIIINNKRAVAKITVQGSDGREFYDVYGTLEEAFAAVTSQGLNDAEGIQIEMLVPETALNQNVSVRADKTVTLTTSDNDLGGYTYSGSGNAKIKRGSVADTASMITNGGTLTLTNITLDGDKDNHPDVSAGGGIINNSGTLTVDTGATLQNSSTSGSGGAILSNAGSVTVSGGTITGNRSSGTLGGGAIYVASGSLTITDGTISNNSATGTNGKGGAIYSASENITVSGGSITGNTAGDGSAIFSNGGIVELTGGLITGNIPGESGAAVSGMTTLNVSGNPTIHDNKVGDSQHNIKIVNASTIHVTDTLTGGEIGVYADTDRSLSGKVFAVDDVTGGSSAESLAHFTNDRVNNPQTGSPLTGMPGPSVGSVMWETAVLTVEKTVSGAMGDTTRDFTFTLTAPTSPADYSGDTFKTVKNTTEGTLTTDARTFTLKHDESIDLYLPYNAEFSITEAEVAGYKTWMVTDSELATAGKTPDTIEETAESTDRTKAVTLTGEETLNVRNRLDSVSPTGVNLTYAPYLLMMLFGGLLLALRRRKRYNK